MAGSPRLCFLTYARSLPAPDLYGLLRRAEPISNFAVHKFPSNLRRHYEALRRFPTGFLVIGDAMCSFNPIYAQGMTVAALESEALEQAIAALEVKQRGAEALPRAFFKAAARIIDRPWMLAVGEDFRFEAVTGPKPPLISLVNWSVAKLHEAATADPEVYRAFLDVLNLTRAPTTVFTPRVAFRALRHRLIGVDRPVRPPGCDAPPTRTA